MSKSVKTDSRNAFAIQYFLTEEDALEYAAWVESQGYTYNGGFQHGRPCGREKGWDYVDKELGQLYAVTD
jgi:hypothetical protein